MWRWAFVLLMACQGAPMKTSNKEPKGAQAQGSVVEPVVQSATRPPGGKGGPNFLPRPYTSEQIRDGLPLGTVMEFAIIKAGVHEKTRWTITKHTASEVTLLFETWNADGSPGREPFERKSPWEVLRDHATYPLTVTLENAEVEVGLGKRKTWLYTDLTTTDSAEIDTVRYHFGYDEPGPPLLHTVTRKGTEVFRMEMTSRTLPSPP